MQYNTKVHQRTKRRIPNPAPEIIADIIKVVKTSVVSVLREKCTTWPAEGRKKSAHVFTGPMSLIRRVMLSVFSISVTHSSTAAPFHWSLYILWAFVKTGPSLRVAHFKCYRVKMSALAGCFTQLLITNLTAAALIGGHVCLLSSPPFQPLGGFSANDPACSFGALPHRPLYLAVIRKRFL